MRVEINNTFYCFFGLKKILTLIVCFFVCLTFINTGSYAYTDYKKSGLPIIINYHPNQYRAESQNWAITQNREGLLYFSNLSGVLEFDGISWQLLQFPNDNPCTSICLGKDGLIYAGGGYDFGYFQPLNSGMLEFRSAFSNENDSLKPSSFIWSIIPLKDQILFQSEGLIFSLKDKQIKLIYPSRIGPMFKVRNNIYIYNYIENEGLYTLDKEKIKKFREANNLENLQVVDILPYKEDKILMFSKKEGLLEANDLINFNLKDSFNLRPIGNKSIDNYLLKHEYSCGRLLKNGNYVFGTISGGILLMSPEGNLIRIIDKTTGLQNETVNAIYEDNNQILWLALDNGISSVNLNVPLSYWPQEKGFDGSILSVQRFKDQLYIGTWQGIYRLDKYSEEDLNTLGRHGSYFKKIPDINARIWSLIPFISNKGHSISLLAGTSAGIYSCKGLNSRLLIRGTILELHQSRADYRKLIIGTGNGAYVLNYDYINERISIEHRIDDLPNKEITKISEYPDGVYWLYPRTGGVYRLTFNNDKPTIKIFGQKEGLNESLQYLPLTISGQLIMVASNGIFQFNDKRHEERFTEIYPILGTIIRSDYLVKNIYSSEKQIWGYFIHKKSRKKILLLIEYQDDQQYKITHKPFDEIASLGINSIKHEPIDQSIWIACDEALFLMEKGFNTIRPKENNILIRNISVDGKVIINNVSTNKMTADINPNKSKSAKGLSLAHNHQSISFEFALTSYFAPESNQFKCFLEGYDKNWSSWSFDNKKNYSRLSPGDYTFRVKSLDVFGFESEQASISFKVLPPWYKTIYAFIGFVISGSIAIFIIVKMSNKRLEKAKASLEQIVQDRTKELEAQQKMLAIEKEKSDKLLKNILPAAIAKELKQSGSVKAQYYDHVTIMFMDFKDFSKISQYINPLQLLGELDKSFRFFDEVCARHKLEKIKTIGDAYMCAGGIPTPNKTNPIDAILAAIEILDFIRLAEKNQWLCDLRIGIHTGELVAGVIGKDKFTYDVWGESVNTASRMESSGVAGKINISGETYEIVKDFFECEHRGILPAKHHDEFNMYFVKRIHKDFSADSLGKKPNELFWNKMKEKFFTY